VLPATVPASALAVVPSVSSPVPHQSLPQSRSLPVPLHDSSPEDTESSSLVDYQGARNTAAWVEFYIIAVSVCMAAACVFVFYWLNIFFCTQCLTHMLVLVVLVCFVMLCFT